MTVRFAARTDWPHPVTPPELRRSRWTFKAPLEDTLDRLRHELTQLGADDALVEAAVRPQDVLRSGAGFSARTPIPVHPGVTVTVRIETGVRVFATDVCETWEHNLRSIALGLEALRAVSRYGITPRGEQYAGFLAIESGATPQLTAGAGAAARILGQLAGLPDAEVRQLVHNPELRRRTYRLAAVTAHPDRGGDPADWASLTEAMRILDGPQ